jgi:hypothetical protein
MKNQPLRRRKPRRKPARSVPGGLVVYGFLRRSETHFAFAAKWRRLRVALRLESAAGCGDIASPAKLAGDSEHPSLATRTAPG